MIPEVNKHRKPNMFFLKKCVAQPIKDLAQRHAFSRTKICYDCKSGRFLPNQLTYILRKENFIRLLIRYRNIRIKISRQIEIRVIWILNTSKWFGNSNSKIFSRVKKPGQKL